MKLCWELENAAETKVIITPAHDLESFCLSVLFDEVAGIIPALARNNMTEELKAITLASNKMIAFARQLKYEELTDALCAFI